MSWIYEYLFEYIYFLSATAFCSLWFHCKLVLQILLHNSKNLLLIPLQRSRNTHCTYVDVPTTGNYNGTQDGYLYILPISCINKEQISSILWLVFFFPTTFLQSEFWSRFLWGTMLWLLSKVPNMLMTVRQKWMTTECLKRNLSVIFIAVVIVVVAVVFGL